MNEHFVRRSADYYAEKLKAHGPTHRGVDWNSVDSQSLRFRQLLKVAEDEPAVAVTDYGCGYGALVDYLTMGDRPYTYIGFDAAPTMVEAARARHAGKPAVTFTDSRATLTATPFTVASGVFYVKQDAPNEEWWEYVAGVLDDMASLSSKGFAFNLLTLYSDPPKRRPDLFYADPGFVLDFCVRRYSRHVAVLHDYPLYEFTVLVRLDIF
jgi:SAM-dependent methyltransferase